MNPQAMATLQGHIQEHIGMLAEAQAQQDSYGASRSQRFSRTQRLCRCYSLQIERQAAILIADLTEEFTQSVEPMPQGEDPLVAIRQQELAVKSGRYAA